MIEDLKIKFEGLKSTLTPEQQKFLHFGSIDNFLFHFNSLKNYQAQIAVKQLLQQYFDMLDTEGHDIDKDASTLLGKEFILKIGRYYRFYSHFKLHMSLSFALFAGIHVDVLLLIIGVLKQVYYIPIVTLAFLSYWLYSKVLYENRKKVYDIRY